MHIIRILSLVVLFNALSTWQIQAQQALLSSGTDANGVGGSVAYSIGQTDYVNFSSDSGRISLGVQQPLVIIMVGTDEPKSNIEVSAYPNPVNVAVNLKLTVESATLTKNKFSYNLYDINGNLVAQKEINDVSTIIPMGELASGMYILRVAQNNAEVRTFKLFKTN